MIGVEIALGPNEGKVGYVKIDYEDAVPGGKYNSAIRELGKNWPTWAWYNVGKNDEGVVGDPGYNYEVKLSPDQLCKEAVFTKGNIGTYTHSYLVKNRLVYKYFIIGTFFLPTFINFEVQILLESFY